jgi:predicted nucleic acid-binding Zn ribbon protein
MEEWKEEQPERYCLVCGHPLGPLGRICDKCGSIRRPAKVIGLEHPPENFSSCERCGEKIPSGKKYCPPCAAYIKDHAKDRAKKERQARPSLLARLIMAVRRLFGGRTSDDGGT